MKLISLKTVVQNEAVEYKNPEFYGEYLQRCEETPVDFKTYNKIVNLFFLKFKEVVFKGNRTSTPIGLFTMVKKKVNQSKLLLKPKGLREEHTSQYRQNDYYYAVRWFSLKNEFSKSSNNNFDDYYFRVAQGAGREIPQYTNILDLCVK